MELGAIDNGELIKHTFNNWMYLFLHSCKSFLWHASCYRCFLLVDSLYVFDLNPFITFISESLALQLEIFVIFWCLKLFCSKCPYKVTIHWQVTFLTNVIYLFYIILSWFHFFLLFVNKIFVFYFLLLCIYFIHLSIYVLFCIFNLIVFILL